MPLYDFRCDDCGPFRAWGSIKEPHASMLCPACGIEGQRLIMATNLARLSSTTRRAHAINERSAHEPRLSRKPAPAPGGHTHNASCGHGHAHSHGPSRPWMIGH